MKKWVSALQSRDGNVNNNNVKLVLSISGWVGRPFNHGVKGANALYHHWTVSGANCGHISLSGSPGWPTIWPAGAPPWLNADKVPVTGGLSCEPARETDTKWNRAPSSSTPPTHSLQPPERTFCGPARFHLSPLAFTKLQGSPGSPVSSDELGDV